MTIAQVFGGLLLNAFVAVTLSCWHMWIPYAKTQWKSSGKKRLFATATMELDQTGSQPQHVQEPQRDSLTPMDKFILALGDVNLISGLAIMISSMIKSFPD